MSVFRFDSSFFYYFSSGWCSSLHINASKGTVCLWSIANCSCPTICIHRLQQNNWVLGKSAICNDLMIFSLLPWQIIASAFTAAICATKPYPKAYLSLWRSVIMIWFIMSRREAASMNSVYVSINGSKVAELKTHRKR